RDTIARYCADHFGVERAAEQEGRPLDRTRWRDLGALGIFKIMLPESDGGVGLGAVEAAIVFEQLGSHVAPGPFVWSTVAAGLIDGAADGARVVGGFEPPVVATDPVLVEHAADLDALIVLAPGGISVVDGTALPEPEPRAPFDPLTPVGEY